MLLAAAPFIFALSTWNPGLEHRPLQDWSRSLWIPVLLIEAIALFGALRLGARPLSMLEGQSFCLNAALAALVGLALATATAVAAQPQLALVRTLGTLLHLGLALSLASLFASGWNTLSSRVWPLLVLGTCALLPVIALYVAAIPDPARFDWENFWLAGSNVRQLGFYCVVGAAGALGLAEGAADRRRYLLWTLAATSMIALACWSGTRSALIAAALSFALGFATLPALRSRQVLAAAFISFAGGALLSLTLAPPSHLYGITRMVETTAQPVAGPAGGVGSGRVEMWLGTIQTILERPFFGHGAGQFRFVVEEAGARYSHPHNLFLQLLVEWGVAGTLLFLSLAVPLWWRFHRAVRDGGADLLPAFLVVNGLIALSMIEGALYHPWPVMIAAIGFAFVLTSQPASAAAAPATG
ncbi:MAG TPA: O-antigen ligase family protein [Allosphingosinicella sp.]